MIDLLGLARFLTPKGPYTTRVPCRSCRLRPDHMTLQLCIFDLRTCSIHHWSNLLGPKRILIWPLSAWYMATTWKLNADTDPARDLSETCIGHAWAHMNLRMMVCTFFSPRVCRTGVPRHPYRHVRCLTPEIFKIRHGRRMWWYRPLRINPGPHTGCL